MAARSTSLVTSIYGFVALGALLAAAGALFVVTDRLAAFRQEALAQAVTVRARGAELDFARALHQEWRNARTIAEKIATRDPVALRSSLDLIVGDNSRVSWAGLAALDGTVQVASGGLLEGQNVSARPWFQQGMQGDFAGDVHDAVLLAKLLPAAGDEPRRFLDLATPVRDAAGRTTGVLGLHLDQKWAEQHLARSAEALQLDIFVINREGKVVLSTDAAASGGALDLPSVRAATTGATRAAVERWPDGQSYLTSVVPAVAFENLPSFGWSVVARIDDSALGSGTPQFSGSLIAFLLGFGLLLAAMTVLFTQIFAVPFSRLAASARGILAGEPVYPYEARSTTEAVTLSAAVARLQHRQMNAEMKAPPRSIKHVA